MIMIIAGFNESSKISHWIIFNEQERTIIIIIMSSYWGIWMTPRVFSAWLC